MNPNPAAEVIAPFVPLPWQLAPLRDKSHVMLLTGSAGGGKSKTAAEKVHAFCLRYPGAVGVALRKRQEYASKSVVFALQAAIGPDPTVRYNASERIFRYHNGSKIFVAGMGDDHQRQALRSINGNGAVDIFWAEEANALTLDDHFELLARLRGNAASWRQIIYSTNPDSATHWIKVSLMDSGEAAVYFSRAADNPHNPADYLAILDKLTGVLGDRLNKGLWVSAEGAVYDNFRDDLHVVDPFPIPADWRRIRAIDFGYTNPFVCQWWAFDPDGRMYLYREIYHTKELVENHAAQIVQLSAGENIEATVADHDAEDRATLAAHGVYTIPADKAVSPGIQAVRTRIDLAGDGKPRLYVFRNVLVELDESLPSGVPHCTLDEFPSYSWPKGQDGKAIKEAPVKANDHGMDTMKYAVAYAGQETGLLLWGQ
jgi:phage terminase large subunit